MSFRDSACGDKMRYQSKHQAKRGMQKHLGKPLRSLKVYQCPYCHLFHLGNNTHEIKLTELA